MGSEYNEKETERRREEALKRMLATPPVKHADQKASPRKPSSVKAKKLTDSDK